MAWRYKKPGSSTEFFIVENRGSGDPYAAYTPDKGIVIWHIDSAKSGNDQQQRTATEHYEVSVEQADGAFHLENDSNNGDSSDYFDSTRRRFSDSTTPDAHWWDGTHSGFVVEVKSPVTAAMTVDLGPTTLRLHDDYVGTVLRGSTRTIRWEAEDPAPLKIELIRAGIVSLVIAESVSNTGQFSWTIPADFPVGSGYQLRLRQSTTPIREANSQLFAIQDEQFPTDSQFPAGFSSTGKAWTIDSTQPAFEGIRSIRSGVIADRESSTLSFTGDFQSGSVRFAARVSSEANYDFLSFAIDGQKRSMPTTSGLAGEIPWSEYNFPISAGTHTLTWVYTKDGSISTGSDAAWLDLIVLPLSTPFQKWQRQNFTADPSGLSTGAGQSDPDADGLSNLLEYATGSNPNRGNSAESLQLRREPGGGYSLEIGRNSGATDTTLHWWWSPDLQDWTELNLSPVETPVSGGASRLRAPVPAAQAEGFFRAEARLKQP